MKYIVVCFVSDREPVNSELMAFNENYSSKYILN
jgi:hypothetical protein